MRFQIQEEDGSCAARTGLMSFPSGEVETPIFMPVGTRATVKGLTTEGLRECGATMVLANAYHLALRPGPELVADVGGLHRFMGWDGPILTDSGGYQVFSLSDLNDVNDDGVEFRSPIDGSLMHLGPREAMRIQEMLGPDVAMVLDECPPYPCSREDARSAVERTLRWAEQCQSYHERDGQALFAIVQGGVYNDLREFCAESLCGREFDGYAIGGVSVGEPDEERRRMAAFTARLLPREKPRYLMGVGFPLDLLHAVAQGVDMFDCVAPTRMGRNATAFTRYGRVRIRNSCFKRDTRPVEPTCDCACCRLYSRAYLNHLFRNDEMLGPILLTVHNLTFYHRLMSDARNAIEEGRFESFRQQFVSDYLAGKEDSQ